MPKKIGATAEKKPGVSGANMLDPLNIKPYKATKNEPYMNEKQVKHFEVILRAWKKQLMEEVDRTIKDMQEDVVRYPDVLDLATQEEEFRLKLRERDRERKLLKKIDEALERIESGTMVFVMTAVRKSVFYA
jgi:DnaK suppressor protein